MQTRLHDAQIHPLNYLLQTNQDLPDTDLAIIVQTEKQRIQNIRANLGTQFQRETLGIAFQEVADIPEAFYGVSAHELVLVFDREDHYVD